MVIYSIDFRSSQTVRHTVTVIYASEIIARLMGASETEIERIEVAAMLHDIGKIGTPVNILESNDRLSDSEMAIMKEHVSLTRSILEGNLDDDIVNTAANHHEKLDGSGYPKGLYGGEIAPHDRIVAVADIFSALCYARSYKEAFSKEKVIGILKSMSEKGQLDLRVVEVVTERYDYILEETNRLSQPVIAIYEHLTQEYEELKDEMERTHAAASLTG